MCYEALSLFVLRSRIVMRQVWTTRVGSPEVLEVRETDDPTPETGQVRIRVHASGINFADVMGRLGLYPDAPKFPAVMGYEVSGIIDAVGGVGEGANFRVGEKVIGLCRFGGHSDVVVLPENQVFRMPDNLNFPQAAAIPVNYLTAYQMLFVMGGVKKGDRVLVHSAAGGVGLAAIDLCKIADAQVIGLASKSKHEALRERGVLHTIDYRTEDVVSEVKRITLGRGVQIVLDAVGGDSWEKSFECLGPTGRLVVFGFSSAAASKKRGFLIPLKQMLRVPWLKFSPISLMNSNKGVLGVNLGHLWNETEMLHAWGEQLLLWAKEGKISPTVSRQFKLSEAAEAHHFIQDRKNIGKVILIP
jgi:synaptic vesicle membrane protein VAT-1